MRLSAARSLPSARVLRQLTSRIAWGQTARQFDNGPVVLLPHHADLPTGEAYITWSPGIVVRPGTTVTWRITERGATEGGEATLEVVDGTVRVSGTWPLATLPVVANDSSAVVEGGHTAMWELVSLLEKHVAEALAQANRYVARELEGRVGDAPEGWSPDSNHGAVDDVALGEIASELLYGGAPTRKTTTVRKVVYSAEDAPVAKAMRELAEVEAGDRKASTERIAKLTAIAERGLKSRPQVIEQPATATAPPDSVVLRMAVRSALTSINNQPLGNWWAVNIRRSAEEHIRRRIGDPHIGPKIRRFTAEYVRTHDSWSFEDLLAKYRAANPRDRAGTPRLLAALTAGKTIDATSHSLSLTNLGDELIGGGE